MKNAICTVVGNAADDCTDGSFVIPDFETATATDQQKMQIAIENLIVNLVRADDEFWTTQGVLFSEFKNYKIDTFICDVQCPYVLPWSEWNCHCEYGTGVTPQVIIL